MKLPIVIPCYDERKTIRAIVDTVRTGFATVTGDAVIVQDANMLQRIT